MANVYEFVAQTPAQRAAAYRARQRDKGAKKRQRSASVRSTIDNSVDSLSSRSVPSRSSPAVTAFVTPVTPVTAVTPAVTEPVTKRDAVTMPVTVRHVTLVTAIALAVVSAGMAVTGTSALCPGAFWVVVTMGVTLEVGKLVSVNYVTERHGPVTLRYILVTAIVTLMAMNMGGVYGFLSQAHLRDAVTDVTPIERDAAVTDGKIKAIQATIDDTNEAIAEINAAVHGTNLRGVTRQAMTLAKDQDERLAALQDKRTKLDLDLANLHGDQAEIGNRRLKVEAEHQGPLKYTAELLGVDHELLAHYVFLLFSGVLDPLAICLLWAARARDRVPANRP